MNNINHPKRPVKRSVLFNMWFILIISLSISSCVGNTNNDGGNILQSGSSQNNNESLEISVPNSPSTSDIFKQIIWASIGVGEGGSIPEPLGNCNNCEVEDWPYPHIKLFNFDPNQSLLLVAYKQRDGNCYNIGDFYATWYVKVDSSGNLDILLSGNSSNIFVYSVYDKNTGNLEWQWAIPLVEADCNVSNSESTSSSNNCDGSIPTRIQVGDNARVTYTKGDPVRLRSEPTIQSKIIALLAEGTQFSVLEGPTCKDGYSWWYVQTSYGNGWIAEGTNSNWFIEPLN